MLIGKKFKYNTLGTCFVTDETDNTVEFILNGIYNTVDRNTFTKSSKEVPPKVLKLNDRGKTLFVIPKNKNFNSKRFLDKVNNYRTRKTETENYIELYD